MREIQSAEALAAHLASGAGLDGEVLQGLDLTDHVARLKGHSLAGAMLLGCSLPPVLRERAAAEGALVFPRIEGVPFDPYRNALYRVEDLYDRFDYRRPESYAACLDAKVYAHWQATGGAQPRSIRETLARRLHDHAMTDALEELLHPDDRPDPRVVGVMGGHKMSRAEPAYRQAVTMSRALSRRGFLMATGGGPGAMEAAHVGSWFAAADDAAVDEAIALLAEAPTYRDPLWLAKAFEVRARFPASPVGPARHVGLGIPTWLYGHEPPNAFATHIAKYFANSVREDGLLTIARHGIVYTPGSAGTIQEIFQDACQNHYVTAGVVSPMIFFGVRYWTEEKPVFPLLQRLAAGMEYGRWLSITDDPDEAVATLERYAAETVA
ncbi:MAG: hypothetical protein AAGN82_09925, partial [Myxococcota bacterium]